MDRPGGGCGTTPAGVDTRPRVVGHAAVRAAAKDWQRFSSDLQGDRDVRGYRQLPLEVDPPRHTGFRRALAPLFADAAMVRHEPRFTRLARGLIDGLSARGGGDVVADVALPYVVGCLTIVMGRPQDHDEWLSWGPDVWTARAHAARHDDEVCRRGPASGDSPDPTPSPPRSGEPLHGYLERVLDRAEARLRDGDAPSSATSRRDVWDRVCRLAVNGEPITREEMVGVGSVLLAGGRDTVIALVTGLVWHLLTERGDRLHLASHPEAIDSAVAEMVRYLSPLPAIERLDHQPEGRHGDQVVVLDFASANHDPAVRQSPEHVDIRRPRTPHLGFGYGRHACLGKSMAEHEARAFVSALLGPWPAWELDGAPDIRWAPVAGAADAFVLREFLSLAVVAGQP